MNEIARCPEILPCPFECKASLVSKWGHSVFHKADDDCPLSMKTFRLDVWNRRPAAPYDGKQVGPSEVQLAEFARKYFPGSTVQSVKQTLAHYGICVAPDDGKGQPELVEYLKSALRVARDGISELRDEFDYEEEDPTYRKLADLEAHILGTFIGLEDFKAPQGWQQGAAREIRDLAWKYAHKLSGGISADEIEAILKRHQERK